MLASGSQEYLNYILSKLSHHEGLFIYCTNILTKGQLRQDIERIYAKWAALRGLQGLRSRVLAHAEFGGVTSAIHLISYWGVEDSVFDAPPALPRVLAHILNSASPDAAGDIDSPPALPTETRHSPVLMDSLLRQEGLYNVFRPDLHIACPCMFKATGWAERRLSAKEYLRAFDSPLDMDTVLLDPCRERRIRSVLPRGILAIVASAIFHSIWSEKAGGSSTEAITSQQGQTLNKEDRMENEERNDSWTLWAEEHSKDEALIWALART